MSVRTLALTAVVAGGIGLWAGNALSQEGGEKAPPKDPMAEWAEWMALQQPNENHARMGKMVGEWDVASKFWMMPGQPPTESTAKATFKSLLDGRYLQHDFAGDVAGMPFRGMSILGYDNLEKVHRSLWIDSMSTGFFLSEGTYDPETKTLTEEGEVPMSAEGPPVKHRMVSRMEGDDQWHFEMYSQGEDGEFHKGMELVYTRKGEKKE